MKFELFIARRHLIAKKETGFISLIAWLCVAGVMLGTAAIILTVAIVNGFEQEVREKIIEFDSHIRLRQYHSADFVLPSDLPEYLSGYPEITAKSAYLEGEAIVRSGSESDGVLVQAVESHALKDVVRLNRFQVSGNLDLGSAQKPGIVIGEKLAGRLNLEIGSILTLFAFDGPPAPGNPPSIRQFEVRGMYSSGIREYDDIFVYVLLEEGQKLFRKPDKVTGVQLVLQDREDASLLAAKIESDLGYPYYPVTWYDRHSKLFDWLRIQKYPMTIVFSLIIVVAAFNIISTLVMLVMEKNREVGILRSIGCKASTISRLFLLEGAAIGLAGTTLGVLLAWLLGIGQEHYRWFKLPADVYFMDALPVLFSWQEFVLTPVFSVSLCLLATVYPALRAGRLQPVQILREQE